MALTWKNVAATNQSNALGFMNSAGQDISNAFKQARNITDDYSQLNASNAELEAMANDPTITPEERTGLLHTAANQNISGKDKQALIKGLKAERGHKLEQDKWKFTQDRAGIEDNQWTRVQDHKEDQDTKTNTRKDNEYSHKVYQQEVTNNYDELRMAAEDEERRLAQERWQKSHDAQVKHWGDSLRSKGTSGSDNDDDTQSAAIGAAGEEYYRTGDKKVLATTLANLGLYGSKHAATLNSFVNAGAKPKPKPLADYVQKDLEHRYSTLNDNDDKAQFNELVAAGRAAGLRDKGLRALMADAMDKSYGDLTHWDVKDKVEELIKAMPTYLAMEGKYEAVNKHNDPRGNILNQFMPANTPKPKNPSQRSLSRLQQKP